MVAKRDIQSASESVRGRSVRSVVLGWTDEETGEQVVVDVHGMAAYLDGLEAQGFVVLRDDGTQLARPGRGEHTAAGAADRTAMGVSDRGFPRSSARRASSG